MSVISQPYHIIKTKKSAYKLCTNGNRQKFKNVELPTKFDGKFRHLTEEISRVMTGDVVYMKKNELLFYSSDGKTIL